MAYIQVDVDLDEFETYELIDEIVRRFKSFRKSKKPTDKQIEELKTEVKELFTPLKLNPFQPDFEIKTLDDKMKMEHLIAVWDKYTYTQIESLLK